MKNKIAFKLTIYFSAALLLFSIIIGTVFVMLFKNQTTELYEANLETRASTMAQTLSEYMSSTSSGTGRDMGMMSGGQVGYGAYLKLLDKIAMADVWIVDENLQLITTGHMTSQQFNYKDLPQDAASVVKKVFQGETTISKGFSTLKNKPTLTVGTPIIVNDKVIGALLLHSPIEGMNHAINQGFHILVISIFTALLLSLLLSIILAVAFTKPLKKMNESALKLEDGDYSVKTGIHQNDEIGELASTIDVLSNRLNLASKESKRLDKLRRDFVSNISHELRTPVTVIRGSLEALYDGVITDSEQIKSYYHQMLNESIFLQRLINDLLELSRLQNLDFKIEKQGISLCDILSDVVRSAKHLAQQKNVEIRMENESAMCSIIGDYGRLRQMFLIVLDNAIKFSPESSFVLVSLKDKTVKIKDIGKGIDKKDLPYIFDRFYQVKSEENKTGTGLGLAIAKQIAERHNITISVNSEINEGTEFQFNFE